MEAIKMSVEPTFVKQRQITLIFVDDVSTHLQQNLNVTTTSCTAAKALWG